MALQDATAEEQLIVRRLLRAVLDCGAYVSVYGPGYSLLRSRHEPEIHIALANSERETVAVNIAGQNGWCQVGYAVIEWGAGQGIIARRSAELDRFLASRRAKNVRVVELR